MIIEDPIHQFLDSFCVAGINYRKSDISIRGKFSLLPEHSISLLDQAVKKRFPGCMVLSTCNRTEIYGICDHPNRLIEMLCIHTHGNLKDFVDHGYQYMGLATVEHLFKVAAGLDSQIIGDYEILSQLKLAAKQSKEHFCLNSFMERVVNFSLQSSKEIKTKTKLSSGTVSVSFAAIEIIKERISNLHNKKILLVGTGKFGNHIGGNLKNYLPGSSLLFANRTDQKALSLAKKCNGTFVPYKTLGKAANNADVIIVSSAADTYTIIPSFFTDAKTRLILDLSVPQNVDPTTEHLQGITLLNVDEISIILEKTISLRQAEIPKATEIINNTMIDLCTWYRKQAINPLLHIVKSQLFELSEIHLIDRPYEEKIHKAVSSLAIQLHQQNNKGCQCISTLSNYLHMN
ncbi:MAG: glutamyl-tRNA reductase [Ginsengibacter sp.]